MPMTTILSKEAIDWSARGVEVSSCWHTCISCETISPGLRSRFHPESPDAQKFAAVGTANLSGDADGFARLVETNADLRAP